MRGLCQYNAILCVPDARFPHILCHHLSSPRRAPVRENHLFHLPFQSLAVPIVLAPPDDKGIRHGSFRVIVGKTQKDGMALDEAMLHGFKLGRQDLFLIPVIAGSKRGGVGKIVAGIALIGLSMMTGGTALMGTPLFGIGSMTGASISGAMGAGLLLNGVASMLAPEQKAEDSQQSFTMTGPQNTMREGGIIPIAYGKVWTGGTLINGALSIRQREDNGADLFSLFNAGK